MTPTVTPVKIPPRWPEVERALQERDQLVHLSLERILRSAYYWSAQAYPNQADEIRAADRKTMREALIAAYVAGQESARV